MAHNTLLIDVRELIAARARRRLAPGNVCGRRPKRSRARAGPIASATGDSHSSWTSLPRTGQSHTRSRVGVLEQD
jgi:hypothetical protein